MARKLLPVDAARSEVLAHIEPPAPEVLPLEAALGRVVARDVAALDDVPGFDNSAMDGFAVRSGDTAGASPERPAHLTLVGESRAGAPASATVGRAEAIAISTGAALPAGADAVVRVEDTDGGGQGSVGVTRPVEPGQDIRRAGDDLRSGEIAVAAGTRVGAAEWGVLASIGAAQVECAPRPRVAIVCTGDELLAAGEPMRPGGVRNSNAYTLRALALASGAEVVSVTRCPDEADATRWAVDEALGADVAVVCGGVSVGPHDHVKQAFADAGAREVFWGVALRPGRPTWFGVREAAGAPTLAFGLPGNPVSAFVTFVLFVRPALEALAGADAGRTRVTAMLTEEVPRLHARDQAVRCRLESGAGHWRATPTGPQGSHVLTSLLGADGLAIVTAGEGSAAAGEEVVVDLLRA